MKQDKRNKKDMSRRDFLKRLGYGAASAIVLTAFKPFSQWTDEERLSAAENKMTYRMQNGTGEQISLLGFGMMRLPNDQEEVNELVDYAIEHGVNYFDTAPMYMGGASEVLTGNALSRHPRDRYYVATKMSNQNKRLWPIEEAKALYYQSFERLKVDYIDYYLLHSIGGGGDGVEALQGRFIENGLLDFLLGERQAGRIRHLGFSYHGDVRAFDWLLDRNDQYHWDFVQIQMNFIDWRHAAGGRKKDADAEYLYNKCKKLGIQCVVMEPLRGGALGKLQGEQVERLKALRPDDSPARWSLRWVGTHTNILTTLSGMNRMEHLKENVETFSPLAPCTDSENTLLADIADVMSGFPTIPCTTCAYCMPCPYGVDIPGNFAYYNEAVNAHILPLPAPDAADYASRKQQFAEGLNRALPDKATWARACQDCEECLSKCPQQIRIPNQMARIVETLRRR